jgi:hypothetical protein
MYLVVLFLVVVLLCVFTLWFSLRFPDENDVRFFFNSSLCIYIYYNNGMFSHNKVTILRSFTQSHTIKVITKLPNSEQSYKGKVKTHRYIKRSVTPPPPPPPGWEIRTLTCNKVECSYWFGGRRQQFGFRVSTLKQIDGN